MATTNPHLFEERLLGFSLRKPQSWDFMPPAWSPVAQLKNSGNEDWEWMRRASQPFCCARKLHDSPHHVYPTLQVTVRRFQIPTDIEAKALLDSQIDVLSKQYADFSLLQVASDALISGHRANTIRARFTLYVRDDNDNVPFSVLSRTHVIFSPGKAFTLGLSSSTSMDYFDESDCDGIIASVRIGA